MSVKIHLIGRFGNQMFQYAHARALSEKLGSALLTNPWIGERVFQLQGQRINGPQVAEISGYFQDQQSLIYTRRQAKDWFKLRPEVEASLAALIPGGETVAHLRRGDYGALGYVVVSKQSYIDAAKKYDIEPESIVWLSEETPTVHPDFTGELSFLPDFYRMMKAKVLLRANSSFSWWASTLGNCATISPIINGKCGGETEQACEFTLGNWPTFANLPCCSDLQLDP